MLFHIVCIVAFFCTTSLYCTAQNFGQHWGHNDSGGYYNPVLPADFSDLDVIKVKDDYYAISSTMQFSPGMVVLHSKDLIGWQITGHVVNDISKISPKLSWKKMDNYGLGIWAGSIRYYKNKYWVYFGTPEDGFFMSCASNPSGPWSPLHQLWKVKGWDDCCPFLDDDGQLYFIATEFKENVINHKKYNIHLFKMSGDGKHLNLASDTIIYQSEGSEANKLYKFNGFYYHLFSEVKEEGRVIMAERAASIYGPWQVKQLNHVNSAYDREPNQGGLVEAADGKWYYFTHHGSGGFWEGRAASVLPVSWIDGWPIIGSAGKDTIGNMVWGWQVPVKGCPKLYPATSDSFVTPLLQPQWEWNYQPRNDKWSLTKHKGYLRLYATMPLQQKQNNGVAILYAANTLTQRAMRTQQNVATVKMLVNNMAEGGYAGLTHFSTQNFTLFGVQQSHGKRCLVYNANGVQQKGIAITGSAVWLRSVWGYDGQCSYFYSLDGLVFNAFGAASQLTWGSYRGDRIGIFNYNLKAEKGFVDVDWFTYSYQKG